MAANMKSLIRLHEWNVDEKQRKVGELSRLQAELGEATFNSWFKQIELVGAEDGRVMLSVPTRFIRNWVVSHYADRLAELEFARRVKDTQDRRNVLIQRTVKGSVFLSEFADLISAAAGALEG